MKIQFVRAHGAYNSGEVAGFPDEWAAALIARGFAVSAEPVVDAPPAEEPQEDAEAQEARDADAGEVEQAPDADAQGVDAPPADRMVRRARTR